jgi:hypothetical protein
MKSFFTFLLGVLPIFCFSQTLSAGDIIFVGLNTDNPDDISFVALKEIPANTIIYITENNWDGSTFPNNEAYFQWSNSSKTLAGSVVKISNYRRGTLNGNPSAPNVNVGTVSWSITGRNHNADFANSGEAVYAYIGTSYNTPTTFLTAIANNGFNDYGTLSGTGLTVGTNAVQFSGAQDVIWYNGSTTCSSTIANCRAMLTNPSNWLTADGAGDQSSSYNPPTTLNGTALPVELISFKAIETNNQLTLHWQTASEINNSHFDIEESTDTKHFKKIGAVKGQGTTNETTKYEFPIITPSVSVAYYRLKQVDFDGRYEYSPIISQKGNAPKFKLLANLVTNNLVIQSDTEEVPMPYSIHNVFGHLIRTDKVMAYQPIDISNLQTGYYFIKTEKGIERFFKQDP